MRKNTFSFNLFLASFLTFTGASFIQVNAQELDFLNDDASTSEYDKSAEYLIPDSPFTEDEKGEKKIKEVTSKDKQPSTTKTENLKAAVKTEEKVEDVPLYNPAEPTTNPVDQDNPLSFNFLYYIIHKFKFADVVDE
ncbi:MAG: hypothetical protein AAGA02_08915 [Bacteroidota bacterium]